MPSFPAMTVGWTFLRWHNRYERLVDTRWSVSAIAKLMILFSIVSQLCFKAAFHLHSLDIQIWCLRICVLIFWINIRLMLAENIKYFSIFPLLLTCFNLTNHMHLIFVCVGKLIHGWHCILIIYPLVTCWWVFFSFLIITWLLCSIALFSTMTYTSIFVSNFSWVAV